MASKKTQKVTLEVDSIVMDAPKKNPFLEGLKEMARLTLAATVSFLLTEGVLQILLSLIDVDLSPTVSVALITSLTLVLKGLDKYFHIEGKNEDDEDMAKGLSRF